MKFEDLETVGDFVDALNKFPREWRVVISYNGGGWPVFEHREIRGLPVAALYNSNGGQFGENPLTEKEYKKVSKSFLKMLKEGYVYTSIHGDHRLYKPSGVYNPSETCYGESFDRRIIERMVKEGLIEESSVDLRRVAYLEG